jgi:hypothetical protein
MGIRNMTGKLALVGAGIFAALTLSGSAKADGLKDDPTPAPTYFSDTSIGYRYGTKFREPGNPSDIEKSILNIEHFNTDKYGANFIDLDFLFSSGNDPVADGSQGATEAYIVLRRYWSYNKITGMNISNSLIRDIELVTGGDLNTKNDPFGSEKRLLVVGPQIDFNVPVGVFNVSFDYSEEWNKNGITHTKDNFDPAFRIEANWAFPFQIGRSAFKFDGFFVYAGPKGKDSFGNQTKGEILTRPEVVLDVGNYWGQKGKFEVGVAYEYWLNKFGNNHDATQGALANTPEIVARYHF